MTDTLTTHWLFDFGQMVRARSGEEGEVIARSERLNLAGDRNQSYRVEVVDPKWGERTQLWFPSPKLTRA